jgi:hypothetical protein
VGHKVARTVYRLRFDTGPLAGATIRARAASMGKYLAITRLRADWVGQTGGRDEEIAYLTELFDALSAALVEWDLEDEDGTPVPYTRAGLDSLDDDVALRIALTWIDTFTGVPDPLSSGSPNGGPSPERSIPMDVLSPAPAS